METIVESCMKHDGVSEATHPPHKLGSRSQEPNVRQTRLQLSQRFQAVCVLDTHLHPPHTAWSATGIGAHTAEHNAHLDGTHAKRSGGFQIRLQHMGSGQPQLGHTRVAILARTPMSSRYTTLDGATPIRLQASL